MFGKVHSGLLSNRKIKSKGKTDSMPGSIFKKVSVMCQTKSREIKPISYMSFWLIWLMEGEVKHKKC